MIAKTAEDRKANAKYEVKFSGGKTEHLYFMDKKDILPFCENLIKTDPGLLVVQVLEIGVFTKRPMRRDELI